MVKTTGILFVVAAIASQQVMAQTPTPTFDPSSLTTIDPALLRSILSEAQATASAIQNNPTYASVFKDPSFSSQLAQASSAASAAVASANAAKGSGSVTKPAGFTALAITAAVAVGML